MEYLFQQLSIMIAGHGWIHTADLDASQILLTPHPVVSVGVHLLLTVDEIMIDCL